MSPGSYFMLTFATRWLLAFPELIDGSPNMTKWPYRWGWPVVIRQKVISAPSMFWIRLLVQRIFAFSHHSWLYYYFVLVEEVNTGFIAGDKAVKGHVSIP